MRLADSFARSHRPAWVWPALLAPAMLAFAGVTFAGGLAARGQTKDSDLTCGGKRVTIVGTAGADRLTGTGRRDVIFAGAGNDVVRGQNGADVICDRAGDDRVSGGAGADLIDGGRGDDRLSGSGGDDALLGRAGADVIAGGGGNDRLAGEGGNDVLRGDAGNDRLDGGAGRDRCVGGPGTDVLRVCESRDAPGPSGGLPTFTPPVFQSPTSPGLQSPTPPAPPSDQPPVAVNDAATVAEDSAAQDVPVLANDTDPDGGPKSIASATQPANGTVQIGGGGAGLTYRPNANYCNQAAATDNFTYTLAPGGSSASVAVRVTCVNDAPVVTTTAGSTGYTENAAAVAIDGTLTVIDPDSALLTGATVQITGGLEPGDELGFVAGGGITGTYDDTTGTLTLSRTASVAAYQAALRSVTYESSSDNPSAGRTVTFRATDTDSAASTTATRDIAITAVNDAPVVTTSAGSTAHTEGPSTTTIDGSLTVTDADDSSLEGAAVRISSGFQAGDDLAFVNQPAISGVYNTGTGVLTLTGTASVADYQAALRLVGFQSTNVNPVTSKTVEFQASDGATDPNAATKEIAVTPVNPSPQVGAGGTLSYTENDPATAVHSGLTVSEPEGEGIGGGSTSITANYQAGQDFLNWTDNNLADNVTLDAINSSQQTIVLTGMDTAANYQAALRAVTYQNGSENPSTVSRTVTFSASDVLGAPGSGTRTIAVTSVDDPPDAVADSATVLEDAAATAIPVLTNDTDVDGGPKTISSAGDPANGTVVVTGGGTGLTYQPDPNYCNDPPGTSPDTFNYTVNGGDSAVVSMTVTCVNDAPVADDETFSGNDSAHGNTAMVVNDPDDAAPNPAQPMTTVSGDILAGDTDIDGPGALTVTPGTFATNDGGSVTIESDGDFTFNPAASTSCTDTSDFFDYTVEDSGSPEQTDTGRVTIAIAGCVWYVSNNAAGNAGTSSQPFDTLAQAETASAANHTVFVFDGDNTSTGYATGYALDPGERLIGEHESLIVDPDLGGALVADTLHVADAGRHPTLTADNEDVIDLDDGNEVRGLNVDPSGAGGGVAGSLGDTGGSTIDDVNIADGGAPGTQPGLDLDSTSGTSNISNLTVSTNGATGVRLNSAGTVTFAPATTISITTAGARGLDATGTNMGTSVFDAITVTGSSNGGLSMVNTTGTTVLSDGSGVDLDLTTTSGTTPAFNLSNAGTVIVDAGGADNVSATGGPAVDVTGTSGATLLFDAVSSSNSADDGINLAGLGIGTFTAASGTIADAAGIAFDLDGGSGAVTYAGSVSDDIGQLVRVANTSGGTKDFNGNISDGGDGDGSGVSLTGNTGATIRFDGGLTLATGGNTAFTATGGGTVAVTDPAGATSNTLATTTGTALSIANTTIHGDRATFQSISSNGGASGVALSNTGSSGGLTVTGNGGACTSAATCTGGAIQNSTGAGIALTSVGGGVGLTRMSVNHGGDDGIRGASVNGFTLANSNVASNGNAVNEHGVDFVGGLTGTAAITNTTVTGSAENHVIVTNASGTLNLTSTDSTFSNASAGLGNDGIHLDANNTANITASVTGATFDNNRGDHFEFSTDGTSSGTNSVTFSSNTLTGDRGASHGGNDLRGGVTISPDAAADTAFTISSNNIQGAVDDAIAVAPGANSVPGGITSGTISGNTIGTAGTVDSGSAQAAGIAAFADGDGTHTIRIENNQIRQWSGSAGIDMLIGDGSPTLNATITGNTLTNPGTLGENGILATAGEIDTDAGTMCAAITGNTLGGSGGSGNTDFRVHQRFLTTFRLPGYTGGAGDTAAVVAFVQGNNPGAETGSATAAFPTTGGGFVGGAAPCPTPPP